jgi:hypothetical protein
MAEESESTELANELFMEQMERDEVDSRVQQWHKLVAGIFTGMSGVVQQKWLWVVGMVFGVVGSIGVALGIISMLT